MMGGWVAQFMCEDNVLSDNYWTINIDTIVFPECKVYSFLFNKSTSCAYDAPCKHSAILKTL